MVNYRINKSNIGKLENLEELSITGNRSVGLGNPNFSLGLRSIPEAILKLKNLKKLFLDSNEIETEGLIPSLMDELPDLIEFSIENNPCLDDPAAATILAEYNKGITRNQLAKLSKQTSKSNNETGRRLEEPNNHGKDQKRQKR